LNKATTIHFVQKNKFLFTPRANISWVVLLKKKHRDNVYTEATPCPHHLSAHTRARILPEARIPHRSYQRFYTGQIIYDLLLRDHSLNKLCHTVQIHFLAIAQFHSTKGRLQLG